MTRRAADHRQNRQRRKSRPTPSMVILFLLIGLILTTIAISVRLSGHWNPEQFYDSGNRHTVAYDSYTIPYDGLEYQADGMYHITAEQTTMTNLMNLEEDKLWNYFYIEVNNISSETLKAELILKNIWGETVYDDEMELYEGLNEIEISPTMASGFELIFSNQSGTSFWIDFMQLRENSSYITMPKIFAMLIIGMGAYCLIGSILYFFFLSYLNLNGFADGITTLLAKLYGAFFGLLGKILPEIPARVVSWLRRLLFSGMIVFMLYTENIGDYNKWNYYKYFLLINGVIVFLIGLLLARQQKRKVNWNNPMILSWAAYSALILVSDILVPKSQMYTGVLMFTAMGVLFFAIARLQTPVTLMKDFSFAVLAVYTAGTIFALLCRPITIMAEGRYLGFTVAPASFALFLIVVIAIFMAEIETCISGRSGLIRMAFYIMGLVSSLHFLWITESRDGVLSLGVCILVYLFRVWMMRKKKNYFRRLVVSIAAFLVICIPVIWIQDWSIHNLPNLLGTTVYFENDRRLDSASIDDTYEGLPGFSEDIVYAAEIENATHILKKGLSLDILSSGRLTIYKEYVANLNLWGHEGDPLVGNRKMRAHNAILQTAYRYGAIAVIPYMIMILYIIVYSIKYAKINWRRISEYPMLPVGLSMSILVLMMFDNVERNFRYLPWIAFYLLIGITGNLHKDGEHTA